MSRMYETNHGWVVVNDIIGGRPNMDDVGYEAFLLDKDHNEVDKTRRVMQTTPRGTAEEEKRRRMHLVYAVLERYVQLKTKKRVHWGPEANNKVYTVPRKERMNKELMFAEWDVYGELMRYQRMCEPNSLEDLLMCG